MTNFIIGMLVGMATVGIIIIIVDQLQTRGFSTNPIDILGGVLLWFWDTMNYLAKKVAKWSVERKQKNEEAYAEDYEGLNEERLAELDAIFEIDEDLAAELDEEMEHIDDVVRFCEGKVI